MRPALTLTAVARRWRTDTQTTRAALDAAGASPSRDYARPRYPLSTILTLEGWNETEHENVDLAQPLLRAEHLARHLGVSAQTVRNYGRTGRLRSVRLSPRTLRYLPTAPCEAALEERANL